MVKKRGPRNGGGKAVRDALLLLLTADPFFFAGILPLSAAR
jgi:hypothetical protein